MRTDTHTYHCKNGAMLTYVIDYGLETPKITGPFISQPGSLPTISDILGSFVSLAKMLAKKAGEPTSLYVPLKPRTLVLCASHLDTGSCGFIDIPLTTKMPKVSVPDGNSRPTDLGPDLQPEQPVPSSVPWRQLPSRRAGKTEPTSPSVGRLKLSKSARVQFIRALPYLLEAMVPDDLEWHLQRYPEDRNLLNRTINKPKS